MARVLVTDAAASTASIDRDATIAFYRSSQAWSSSENCRCSDCAVYRANFDIAFTDEQRNALDRLGIDPRLEGEISWLHERGADERYAWVSYGAIGELVEYHDLPVDHPWQFCSTAVGAHLGKEFVGVLAVITFRPCDGERALSLR